MNGFSFLTTNCLVSIILFVVCRLLFRLLFRYRISVIFRPYSFWPFIVFLAMEGNLQVITFYACSVFRFCFFRNFSQKFKSGLSFFILYFLILFAVAGHFFVFSSFGRLSKYFADNVKPSLRTIFYPTI